MENKEVKVIATAGQVVCDFNSAKQYLQERLEQYQNVVFTEDSKKEAKGVVADLRKEKKAFSDRIKEAKAEYMKPFEAFAAQAIELIEMYDAPINYINGQVAEFERKRMEEKRERIKQLYVECIGDMQDKLPLTKIYNAKWENSTTNPTQIRREMMEYKEKVKSGLDAIKQMHSDAENKAVAMFLESYDLTRAILYINQYEQQQKEILAREQERIRREEEERIRKEEREKMEAERREQEAREQAEAEKQAALERAEAEKQEAVEQAKAEAAQDVVDSLTPDLEGDTNLYEYRMSLTADAKEKLEMYLDSVGIDWEII